MSGLIDKFATSITVGFGLGLMPRAPGTWGSLLGLPLGAAIFWVTTQHLSSGPAAMADLSASGWLVIGLIFTALIWTSRWIIHRTETAWNTHDDGRIVIDEIVGQAMCVAMFRPHLLTYVIGFALFRLLDITKPGVVGWADKQLPGAWGTLLDDVFAGLIAAMLMVGIYEIYTKML